MTLHYFFSGQVGARSTHETRTIERRDRLGGGKRFRQLLSYATPPEELCRILQLREARSVKLTLFFVENMEHVFFKSL